MSEQTQGPVMLAVTNILRPPPARIGKISENFVLPRTIELRKLIAVAVGVLAGMFLWFMPIGLFFSYGLTSLFTMMGVGGFGGYFVVTWSPLRSRANACVLIWVSRRSVSSPPGRSASVRAQCRYRRARSTNGACRSRRTRSSGS
jgi:hypothetical protein